jgi:hypothetical protein
MVVSYLQLNETLRTEEESLPSIEALKVAEVQFTTFKTKAVAETQLVSAANQMADSYQPASPFATQPVLFNNVDEYFDKLAVQPTERGSIIGKLVDELAEKRYHYVTSKGAYFFMKDCEKKRGALSQEAYVEPPDEIRDFERKIFNQYLGDSLTIEKVVSIEDAKRWIVAQVDMEGSGWMVSYVMLRFVSSYLL